MTTNPATRPFLVVVGSGIDVKGKFGKSGFYEVGKTVFVEEANMEIEYRKLGKKTGCIYRNENKSVKRRRC